MSALNIENIVSFIGMCIGNTGSQVPINYYTDTNYAFTYYKASDDGILMKHTNSGLTGANAKCYITLELV